MADQWKPIKLFTYLGSVTPPQGASRETVLDYLNSADPDAIEAAGRSYVAAAKLVQGEGGVQGAVMKAAEELAAVWRGGAAAEPLKALRLLHASAGALGQAMKQTGEPLTKYAGEVRRYRGMVADLPPASEENAGGGMTNGGAGSGGTPAPQITGPDGTTMPVISAYGPGGISGPVVSPDEEARKRLEELNLVIYELNAQIAEGLAFQMPDITPMDVETERAPRLNPGSGTNVPDGTTTYWNGDGTSGGSSGSSDSSGSDRPGSGTRDPGTGPGGSGDETPGRGQDQDGRDPATGSGDDPNTPDRPGDDASQQPEQQQPSAQDQDGGEQDVPAVIGGEDQRTQLADANPTTTTPTTANTSPYTGGTPTTAYTPTTQAPVTAANPFAPPGGPNGGTWYGSGGSAAAASPAVLRGGGPAALGGGFMGYPPGGMGGGLNESGSEHQREFYDPEGDLWSPAQEGGPHTIC